MKIKRLQIRLCVLLLGASLLSGCALVPGMSVGNNADRSNTTDNYIDPHVIPITPKVIQQVSTDLRPYQYHIGIGDQITVTVWSHPEFSTPAGQAPLTTVSSGSDTKGGGMSGFVGKTAGSSVSGYFVNAEGNVFFPLVGQVHVAGLTTEAAAKTFANKLAKYVKNPQVFVHVTNFASQKVYVMGALNQGQNGASALMPINNTPMTLAYALSAVGGVNQAQADTSQIYVIRGSYTHPTIYWLNAESPAAMLYADNFPLQNHDVVFVSTASIVRWNNVLSQILPTVQTVFFTRELIKNP